MTDTPPPGSPEAKAMGCRCSGWHWKHPLLTAAGTIEVTLEHIIRIDCPVHSPTRRET